MNKPEDFAVEFPSEEFEEPVVEEVVQPKPRKSRKAIEPVEEIPEKVYGTKKPKKPEMFESVVITEPIDWQDLSFKMTWADYHELRVKHGLE